MKLFGDAIKTCLVGATIIMKTFHRCFIRNRDKNSNTVVQFKINSFYFDILKM